MQKRILYLGLELPDVLKEKAIHFPIIKIVPRNPSTSDIIRSFLEFNEFTHLLFTSKMAVRIFYVTLKTYQISITSKKNIWVVGKKTGEIASSFGMHPNLIPKQESQEGLIAEIKTRLPIEGSILWPHSSLSRPLLRNFLIKEGVKFRDCVLYDTVYNEKDSLPNMTEISEIIFTSPSTVKAFLFRFGTIPKDKRLTPIGPVTEKSLNHALSKINRL